MTDVNTFLKNATEIKRVIHELAEKRGIDEEYLISYDLDRDGKNDYYIHLIVAFGFDGELVDIFLRETTFRLEYKSCFSDLCTDRGFMTSEFEVFKKYVIRLSDIAVEEEKKLGYNNNENEK